MGKGYLVPERSEVSQQHDWSRDSSSSFYSDSEWHPWHWIC